MTEHEQPDADTEDIINSKTAVKKAMQQLQILGKQLLELSPKTLELLPLSSRLVEAIEQARQIKKGDTLRRQIQLIGKLMRFEDEQGIREKLSQLKQQDRRYQANIESADQWCQQLLEKNTALCEYINRFPHCDRQQLTQLIRLTKSEIKKDPASQQNKYKQRLFEHIQSTLP